MDVDRVLIELDRGLPSGALRTDHDSLHRAAHDESEVEAVPPFAFVRVSNTSDVQHVLRVASARGVPVTARAGGTGRVGGAVPVRGGIVVGFEGMDRVVGIEREDHLAVVQPGVVTGVLAEAVEAEGLFYPPDPNSLAGCCIGGNVAHNAGGPRAFKYGVTRNYVLGLGAVLADGTALSVGRRTTKGVTGYDLTSLFVGSEGTLGLFTEVTLRLVPKPAAVGTLLAYFADDALVARAVSALAAARVTPRCVELMDGLALELVRRDAGLDVPFGAHALVLVELDGETGVVEVELERAGSILADLGALDVQAATRGAERDRLWAARRELSRTLRRTARFKLSEDVVVPRSRMAALLRTCRRLAEAHEVRMPTYGHAGDGNLHVNFLWDDEAHRPRVDAAIEGLFREVVALGGTLSGEHGIGASKAPYLGLEQSDELMELGRRVKRAFDPQLILNPGKIYAGTRIGHGAC